MLELKNITKTYVTGDTETKALDGVSLQFGEKEFVSILGTSGSGKTTMLNVIGGLDCYDSGDLVINGTSTKEYKDRDWDTYRNHSIGFVFQSYNLIPHQTVLSNVELALTLSGVSKSERRKRAKEALEKVGLGDQLKKKPSQMSGGQMQRVAIARALVNDPDILLADEPTGALDTETSVQIMNILHEISKSKLVIMVTHNPDLAKTYSTRIVRLSDGKIISDEANSPEVTVENSEPVIKAEHVEKKKKKTSMSFLTAFSLSLNNLMTKKARTILTSFAGSIGIIGIALILAVSSGVQNYIDAVQEDTLSSYPISIQRENVDYNELLETLSGKVETEEHGKDKIYSSPQMSSFLDSMTHLEKSYNNLRDFKVFLENDEEANQYISALQYSYRNQLLIYRTLEDGSILKVNPSTIVESMQEAMGVSVSAENGSMYSQMAGGSMRVWSEIIPGRNGELVNDIIKQQYDIIGSWPESAEEVVLVANDKNEISDVFLYSLGLMDQAELEALIRGEEVDTKTLRSWDYDELIGLEFYAVLPSSIYSDSDGDGVWEDMSENEDYMKITAESGIKVRVSGIITPNADAVSTSVRGAIGYTHALSERVINATNDSAIVKAQKADEKVDVFTGLPFKTGEETEPTIPEKAQLFIDYVGNLSTERKAELYTKIMSTISDEQLAESLERAMSQFPDRAAMEEMIISAYSQSAGTDADTVRDYIAKMSDEELSGTLTQFISAKITNDYAEAVIKQLSIMTSDQLSASLEALMATVPDDEGMAGYYDGFMPSGYSDSTFEQNLKILSAVDLDDPAQINIYTKSFEAKDNLAEVIEKYNKNVSEDDEISYTDYVAIIMSSVTTIINAISYVLIAFVSISLVVSSIMIGIITYISVLERTKEIGILRAIGASKRDISRVFNAETLIVGLIAGVFGIGITLLLCIPINIIIQTLSGIPSLAAALPPVAGIVLVLISIFLTVIAGLIPSRIAAKKDPVESLRSE